MDAAPGPLARLRSRTVLVGGVLLVVAASALGLHDLADAHLGASTAQHAER